MNGNENWGDGPVSRRRFLKLISAVGLSLTVNPLRLLGQSTGSGSSSESLTMRTRTIPAGDEELPVVGVGTWQQFDVPVEPPLLESLREVLNRLFEAGGSVIDTSPMYGQAESVVGKLLESTGKRDEAFVASKVWTRGRKDGVQQMEASLDKLNVSTIDLMQVHNLVDWETHLPTLRQWKDEGKIRYLGVTHYTQSAFDRLAGVMREEPLDFVQLPYSIGFRTAEKRLLPLAREQEIAVVVNRPFEAGGLFRSVRDAGLPEWAGKIDCESWAQYFLKFILGHPAVTCVIPGTSNPDHMTDNARAGTGTIPDQNRREAMVEYWRNL